MAPRHLRALRQYLYDKEFKDVTTDQRPDFDELKLYWSTQDKDSSSPRQRDRHGYGVVTVLSIYSLSIGVQLQPLRSSYSQIAGERGNVNLYKV